MLFGAYGYVHFYAVLVLMTGERVSLLLHLLTSLRVTLYYGVLYWPASLWYNGTERG